MTEFKLGDKVRINSRDKYDPDLEPAVGRRGVVENVSSGSLLVRVEGDAITAYGATRDIWWFPRSGVALIEEEEEKVVTKFEVGEKVRLLPGARGTTSSPAWDDRYAEGHREGVISHDIDSDGDYFLAEIGYIGAEFLAKFEEEFTFADVKVGDRISARRESVEGAFVTYEDTVVKIDSTGKLNGKAFYISGDDYTLTLLDRPEPEFTSEQYAAVEALEAAGFSRESAEAIVKKGDSA